MTEWLKLALDEPALLEKLGAKPHLGVLITGPAGVGKRYWCVPCVRDGAWWRLTGRTSGPSPRKTGIAPWPMRCPPSSTVAAFCWSPTSTRCCRPGRAGRHTDPDRVAARRRRPGVAFIATSQQPDSLDPRLRAPDLCDRELGLSLPDAGTRRELLEILLRDVPTRDVQLGDIADRTPGFVRADLAALVREAALRAAARASGTAKHPPWSRTTSPGRSRLSGRCPGPPPRKCRSAR